MHRLKLRFALALLLLSVTSAQLLPVYASGIVPKEDFTITPEEGRYNYPENFKLQKGKEYIITGQTEDGYVIKYEILKGIRINVHVPKSKVEYVEETQVERSERERREAIKQFEKEQKAKGLTKVANYWVTKENAELWLRLENLITLRTEVMRVKKINETDEKELDTYHEDIVDINDKIISLQERADSLWEWLENSKATELSSATEISQYNSKVRQHNKLRGEVLAQALKIQRKQSYWEKKSKELGYNTDKYEAEKSKYMEMFSKVEKDVMDSLSKARDDQRELVNFMAKKMQSLSKDKDLMYSIVQVYKYGEVSFVNGVINDKLPTIFVVDTGASYVSLSKSMGKQLQLNITPETPRCNIQLADGSLQDVPLVTLSSISIGGVEQKDVEAVILEDSPNFVALLGMTFLKHFNWRLEGNNRIVFKKLETNNVPKE